MITAMIVLFVLMLVALPMKFAVPKFDGAALVVVKDDISATGMDMISIVPRVK